MATLSEGKFQTPRTVFEPHVLSAVPENLGIFVQNDLAPWCGVFLVSTPQLNVKFFMDSQSR